MLQLAHEGRAPFCYQKVSSTPGWGPAALRSVASKHLALYTVHFEALGARPQQLVQVVSLFLEDQLRPAAFKQQREPPAESHERTHEIWIKM
eukprot:4109774-Pleurochrysis_carterae.AAC.2